MTTDRARAQWEAYLKDEERRQKRALEIGGDLYRQFLDAGYKACKPHQIDRYLILLQKCFRGEDGTKLYFVNVKVWDWTDYPQMERPVSFGAFEQFNRHGDTFEVVLLEVKSVEETERFFASVYERMECEPYGD